MSFPEVENGLRRRTMITITRADIETYRRVLAYFISCDAYSWCRKAGVECDDELAQNIASYVICDSRGHTDWNAIERAYEKCRDFLL